MTSTHSSQAPTLSNPPDSNEIEVSLLGTGFGECVVIHTGQNEWAIIDSCRFRGINAPAALHYLSQVGVELENVKVLVATHWDDDHIRGLGEIVTRCPNAKFVMSSAINDVKFTRIVVDSPLQQAASLGQTASTGISEFSTIYKHLKREGRRPFYASANTIIWSSAAQPQTEMISLSPHAEVFERSIQSIISLIPIDGKPIANIKAPRPNFTSVVLWVKVGEERVLLGADMEENAAYQGWSLLLDDKTCIDKKAAVYKVAHHGSKTGEHDGIWVDLLEEQPVCLIAPWVLAGRSLPTQQDLERISQKSDDIYVSHAHDPNNVKSFKADEKHVKRAMRKIEAKSLLQEFGMVRLRKRIGADWRIECFGTAARVTDNREVISAEGG